MSVLSFEAFKEKGIIEYVHVSQSPEGDDIKTQMSSEEFEKEMDDIAAVMEMSTDELMAELSIRFTAKNQLGLRQVSDEKLIEELTHRLIAIEYILAIAISKYEK
jgi:hypothetical protein